MTTRMLLSGFLTLAGCGSMYSQQAEPPPKPVGLYEQYAPGLLARKAYTADPVGKYSVELWDLLVGPGMKNEGATLPGGAVIEVRSGSGDAVIDGKSQKIKIGSVFSVAEGVKFSLINSDKENPLSMRAVVIRTRQ